MGETARALLAAVTLIALSAGGVAAQTGLSPEIAQSTATYDIPAQDLNAALLTFANRAGLQIFYDVERVRGLRSAPLVGTFTPQQALTQLLAGTGVTFRFTGANTVSLDRPAAQGAVQLDPVKVQANAVPSQAMIDNLPAPYAGGQVAKGAQLGILGNRGFMDVPFNQTSYTAKVIQDQQARTIADVLTNDPSVRIENTSAAGVEDFNIRGFNVANGDILFTGLPGITPTFFNAMMTEGLERVEVLKGPSSFLNGAGPAGSVGGVINVIPKRATNEPIVQFTPEYATSAQFGGHVDFGRRFGADNEFGVRVNAVYRNGNTPIDNQTQEQRLLTFGFDYRGDAVRASADLGYQYLNLQGLRWFPFLAAGVPVPAAPKNTTNFSDPWEFARNENLYGVLRGEVDIVEKLTAFVSVGASQRKQQAVDINRTIVNLQGTLPGSPNSFDYIAADTMYGVAAEGGVRATFDTGPVHHQMTMAYNRFWREWRRITFNGFTVGASNIYNPIYSPGPASWMIPSPDSARKRSETDLSSMAIGDTLSAWDERVQLTLGLRFQQINAWNFNTMTGVVTSSYNSGATTPMVGLVVKPLQNVSVYGNYIQGLQEGATAPEGTVNAGQIFPPFVSEQYEVGLKVDWGKVTTTFAAFQITQPSAFTDPATNTFLVNGQQRNRGLELNVFGELADGVRILSGASLIDARLTQTAGGVNQGNFAVGVPQFRLVLGGEWDLPFVKGLTVLGRVVYESSAYVDQANLQQLPDWAQVNIGLRYAFEGINKKPIVIRANVNNLFDANYWTTTSFGQMSLSQPRTFFLSTSFNF